MSTSLLEYSVSQHWPRTRWVLTAPYSSCMSHVRALTVTEHTTITTESLANKFPLHDYYEKHKNPMRTGTIFV